MIALQILLLKTLEIKAITTQTLVKRKQSVGLVFESEPISVANGQTIWYSLASN